MTENEKRSHKTEYTFLDIPALLEYDLALETVLRKSGGGLQIFEKIMMLQHLSGFLVGGFKKPSKMVNALKLVGFKIYGLTEAIGIHRTCSALTQKHSLEDTTEMSPCKFSNDLQEFYIYEIVLPYRYCCIGHKNLLVYVCSSSKYSDYPHKNHNGHMDSAHMKTAVHKNMDVYNSFL